MGNRRRAFTDKYRCALAAMMLACVSQFCLLFCLPAPAAETDAKKKVPATSTKWKAVSVPKLGFSVKIPADATATRQVIPCFVFTSHRWKARSNGCTYSYYVDRKEDWYSFFLKIQNRGTPPNPALILDAKGTGFFLGLKAAQKGDFDFKLVRDFKIDGHPAKEYEFHDAKSAGRVVFCLKWPISYSFFAISPKKHLGSTDVFFKSIKIE